MQGRSCLITMDNIHWIYVLFSERELEIIYCSQVINNRFEYQYWAGRAHEGTARIKVIISSGLYIIHSQVFDRAETKVLYAF